MTIVISMTVVILLTITIHPFIQLMMVMLIMIVISNDSEIDDYNPPPHSGYDSDVNDNSVDDDCDMNEDARDFEEEYDVIDNIDNANYTDEDDYNSDGECIAAFRNMSNLAPFKKEAIFRQLLQSKPYKIFLSSNDKQQFWEAIVGIISG